jgi:protein transport protein SEC24
MPHPAYPQQQQIPPPGAPFPSLSESASNPQLASTRINPALIPSPVTVNEMDQNKFNETSFVTSSIGTQSPPFPSTMARYVDDGNSSSRFMRLTTYNVPCTEDILHASRMPLALVVQPFAQRPSYEVIPLCLQCVNSLS